ncbi:MAG: aminopeptidase P family protein [Clostridia bacterium]|nr:aminopeptidase P family protein [Clostridia bacterium]
MNTRIRKFKESMKNENLDGFIIKNPINIRYFTGLNLEGTFLINKTENILLTDGRYIEEAHQLITISDEIIVHDIAQYQEYDYINIFAECDKVGFEDNYITYSNYTKLIRTFRIKEAVEANLLIDKMREIKDDNEIKNIEIACNITDECFLYLQDFIKIGMTEKQIAFEIYKFFIEHKAEGIAFDTIVASGKNSSKPHAIPTDKKIEFGDIILIDFGAKYKGYCADMTRTIFVGKVTDIQKNIYKLVLDTQNRALNKMKSNADTKEISEYVKNEFSFNNFEFIHALGHGVGLDIHEKPFFSTRFNNKLRLNMVVTDEPGIYIPNEFGIRIEDTVLINNMEPRVLTKSNKNITIIKG